MTGARWWTDDQLRAAMKAIEGCTREHRARYGGGLPSLESEAIAVLDALAPTRLVIDGRVWRFSSGATQPHGHMLAVLVPVDPPVLTTTARVNKADAKALHAAWNDRPIGDGRDTE